MHEGGLVLTPNRNRSRRGSVLANAMRRASVLGRGDLYGVGARQLWGIWVVIRLVSSGGGEGLSLLTLLPSFPSPFHIPFPFIILPHKTLQPSSLVPSGRPWTGHVRLVVVEEQAGERLQSADSRIWRSFKLRPFSIVISIFIVAYLAGLLKS
jgi:hypothetical protein